MASVKNLKKDIDLIMSLALSDCFYVLEHNKKINGDKVMKIAEEIIEKHHELRVQVNHPEGKDEPKKIKKYYNELVSDMLNAADEALEKLSAEIKKTA